MGGADRNVGAAYNTAIYALILQLDHGGLKWIGQRMPPEKK